MKAVYVTGNAHKAKYFAKMVGLDIQHVALDTDELQSMNLSEIVEHKARQAYAQLRKPVIIEDTKLTFNVLGLLPGTLIKWFLEELKLEGLCKLLDGYSDRSAVAGAAIAYYDGVNLEIFEKELEGSIALKPMGESGFGWNTIFIPDGQQKTLAQMDEQEFRKFYKRIKPFDEVREMLSKNGY